ncbi:hypothetical protein ACA910_017465 [Epithemia clementina (nom. ined.)]
MDFDLAAQRLARDQRRYQNRRREHHAGGGGAAISAKAKREVILRKQQQELVMAQKRKQQRQRQYWHSYMRRCDRILHAKSLLPSTSPSSSSAAATTTTMNDSVGISNNDDDALQQPQLQLQATSIHGEGDKIALPPSVLAYLTNIEDGMSSSSSSSPTPWTFRIGSRNPNYTFPQSKLLMALQPDEEDEEPVDSKTASTVQDDDDEEEDEEDQPGTAAYIDELSHKYLALTHGTVVEFTQEEGFVGLPSTIAAALIAQAKGRITVTRTVDPANQQKMTTKDNDDDDVVVMDSPTQALQHDVSSSPSVDAMEIDGESGKNKDNSTDDDVEKTPGHLAWGAFDIPNVPIEISLVRLPKGRACTLVPTPEAIQNGFYSLKDIKLVLEQSLIRTRAVLSVNDVVHTWHRGVQYNLHVSHVEPADYQAVICINTDISVDFAAPPSRTSEVEERAIATTTTENQSQNGISSGYKLGSGRTLGDSSSPNVASFVSSIPTAKTTDAWASLPPEPPVGAANVCTVQIRGLITGKPVQRRFDLATATVTHLFGLAQTTMTTTNDNNNQENEEAFQLVTRFPRRVLRADDSRTLQEVGLGGQELFMVERIVTT